MNDPRVLIVLCTLGMFAGCVSTQYMGQWRNRDITIDGSPSEWDDYIEYPEHIIPNMGIGAVCDSNHVYLCLTSEDRATVSRMLMAGFSVTFQNPSQKGALFGVYFPLGMKGGGAEGQRHDPEEWAARVEASLQMLALLGPGKKDTTFMPIARAESLGVVVRAKAHSMEQCTYELKARIIKNGNSPYSIVPGKDSSIAVTFECGVLTRPEGRRPLGHSGGSGFGEGPHFGRGEGVFGSSNRPPPGMQQPLKASFLLKLPGQNSLRQDHQQSSE
jgi:hypothetical protein